MIKRRVLIAATLMTVSLGLGACASSPATPTEKSVAVDLAPISVGNYARITNEQAFDSKATEKNGAATTAEFLALVRSSAGGIPAEEFASVHFKGGAKPVMKEVVFYAPKSEKSMDAPTEVDSIVVYSVPEVVNGDKPLDNAFKIATARRFHLKPLSGLVVATPTDVSALAGRGFVIGSGTSKFVQTYAKFVRPLTR